MSGTQARPRRRPRRHDVREALLTAALEEFRTKGFERSSMDEIAERAGFSKGAIYSNFPSKEDLFLALMERQVHSRIDTSAAVAAAADGARPAALGDHLTALSTQDPEWHTLFLEYVVRTRRRHEHLVELTRQRRELREDIATAIDDVQPDNADLPSDIAAIVILALSNGLQIERLIDPTAVPDHLFGWLVTRLLGTARSTA